MAIGRAEKMAKVFGERLNLVRRKKQISMDELALAVGMTKSAISRYENGHISPTLDSARKFSEYFMVTVDWLSGGGDEADALATVPQAYIAVIKRAMEANVTPEKLNQAVDLLKGK